MEDKNTGHIMAPYSIYDAIVNPVNKKTLNIELNEFLEAAGLIAKFGFEFGGVDAYNGALTSNNIRCRSERIRINSTGSLSGVLSLPNTLVPAIANGRYSAFAYMDETPVKAVPDLRITKQGIITFTSDGSYDNIIVGARKMAENIKTNFVFGGIDAVNGSLTESHLRCRSERIYFVTTAGPRVLMLEKPDYLYAAKNSAGLYSAFAYMDETPIKAIPDLDISDDGLITFTSDGTFNNILISLKKEETKTNVVEFEFGGVDAVNGNLNNSTNLRCRSKRIYFPNSSEVNTLQLTIPDTLIPATVTAGYSAFAYMDETPVKAIPNLNISNGVITFNGESTFNNIIIGFKHSDNSEINESEVAASSVTFETAVEISEDEREKCYIIGATTTGENEEISEDEKNQSFATITDLNAANSASNYEFNYTEILEAGSISSDKGAIISNLGLSPSQVDNRFVSPTFIDMEGVKYIQLVSNPQIDIAFIKYDKNYTRIGSTGWMDGATAYKYTKENGVPYIKMLVRYKDEYLVPDREIVKIELVINSSKPKLERAYNSNLGTYPNNIDNLINIECWMHCTNPLSCADDSTNIQDNDTDLYANYGLLLLPENYSPIGKPTPLIVFCHGYSGHYDSTSSIIASTSNLKTDYLLKEGFAVLDMDGNLLDRTKPHACSQMGIDAYIKGIKWAQDRYNVTRDIYLAGHSMGGMMASLLSTIGNSIHIKACCLFAPATSVILLMQLHPEDRAAMANYYGFTGNAPSWGTSANLTTEEKQYVMSNIEKVMKGSILWNYTNATVSEVKSLTHNYKEIPTTEETEFYSSKSRILPHVPTKVFQGSTDASCKKEWTDEFIKLCKNGGMNIEYRVMEGVPHTGDSGITAVGNNTVTTIYGETVNNVPTALYEMVRFFRRY